MKGGGRPTRLLPYAKMLGRLCSGRFWLGRLFQIEKSWHTYQFTVVFVSGRQDLSFDARASIIIVIIVIIIIIIIIIMII